ncbi:hypothetical protein DMUE_3101 [Dictyocoela muelleri]|nr:hypothetical protein DMUE_3101 [Dictyocoela muelleri]
MIKLLKFFLQIIVSVPNFKFSIFTLENEIIEINNENQTILENLIKDKNIESMLNFIKKINMNKKIRNKPINIKILTSLKISSLNMLFSFLADHSPSEFIETMIQSDIEHLLTTFNKLKIDNQDLIIKFYTHVITSLLFKNADYIEKNQSLFRMFINLILYPRYNKNIENIKSTCSNLNFNTMDLEFILSNFIGFIRKFYRILIYKGLQTQKIIEISGNQYFLFAELLKRSDNPHPIHFDSYFKYTFEELNVIFNEKYKIKCIEIYVEQNLISLLRGIQEIIGLVEDIRWISLNTRRCLSSEEKTELSKFYNLEKLEIKNLFNDKIFNFPKLDNLKILSLKGINSKFLNLENIKNERLESLTIDYSSKIFDKIYLCFNNLKHLTLNLYYRNFNKIYREIYFLGFLSNVKKLDYLGFSFYSQVDIENFGKIDLDGIKAYFLINRKINGKCITYYQLVEHLDDEFIYKISSIEKYNSVNFVNVNFFMNYENYTFNLNSFSFDNSSPEKILKNFIFFPFLKILKFKNMIITVENCNLILKIEKLEELDLINCEFEDEDCLSKILSAFKTRLKKFRIVNSILRNKDINLISEMENLVVIDIYRAIFDKRDLSLFNNAVYLRAISGYGF